MARTLIRSSNICLFYKPQLFKDYKLYIMVKSNKFEPLACLEDGRIEAVISVLDFFLIWNLELLNLPKNQVANGIRIILKKMSKHFTNCINKLNLTNMYISDAISAMLQKLETDMVHLIKVKEHQLTQY
jgi:hypothetical protein